MATFVTTGLANDGKTAHYQVEYDSTLDQSVGQAAATALMAGIDSDFELMTSWFGGIASPWSGLMTVQIQAGNTANGGTGASWPNLGGPITLIPGLAANSATASVNSWFVRYLLVSEVVEMFMDAQGKGWYGGTWTSGGNEGSAGEGLSRFLGTQFLLLNNQSLSLTAGYDIAFTWLQSTARADFVNHVDGTQNGFVPQVGCAILFIYYLFTQLGFTIDQIVAAGADELGSVYKNLTGDSSDPFPYFKQLLDVAFPGTSTITAGNLDDPYPLGSLSFWGVKDTWSRDEVTDIVDTASGRYPTGFWLALEGFNRQVVGSAAPALPDVAFTGVSTALDVEGAEYQTGNPYVPQRILFPYDMLFTAGTEGAFPASGVTPAAGTSSITLLGTDFPATTEFFFTAGADPYFSNVLANPDPSAQNVPWLSQDLRVFTAIPGRNVTVTGGPAFASDGITGAYTYIRALIKFLNTHYGDPSGTDPFDVSNSILPGQAGAYTGDSSVTPYTKVGSTRYNNYNFAVARVRLRGSQGTAGQAAGVRVFFRLWGTQTADTDWNPTETYPSHTDSGGNPLWPLAPSDSHTIPFFATSNTPDFSSPTDPEYGPGGANNQTIEIRQGDAQWAYFGCFLNVYDPTFKVSNTVVQNLLPSGHHCLVAQIAYPGDPIEVANGVTPSPELSAQLAQRNLQVTTSDNPGSPATHLIPQTFDARPSPAAAALPDELMIDWGNTPVGSTARIYWPAASAAQIVSLSAQLYGLQALTAADANTVQCQTTSGLTYVPIPPGAGVGLAGLLTVDLPPTVVKGQEFDVVIRRIGTRTVTVPQPIQIQARTGHLIASAAPEEQAATADDDSITERYVVGSFQVKIPVSTAETMLGAEEDLLAVFKARLAAWSPGDRWYPVLVRYVDLIAARVDGLGGHAQAIPPSLGGYQPEPGGRLPPEHHEELIGKVAEVLFDCFGDLDGFVLRDCQGEHAFAVREPGLREILLEVCRDRLRLAVSAEHGRVIRLAVLPG